jgi:hypothetical protein
MKLGALPPLAGHDTTCLENTIAAVKILEVNTLKLKYRYPDLDQEALEPKN